MHLGLFPYRVKYHQRQTTFRGQPPRVKVFTTPAACNRFNRKSSTANTAAIPCPCQLFPYHVDYAVQNPAMIVPRRRAGICFVESELHPKLIVMRRQCIFDCSLPFSCHRCITGVVRSYSVCAACGKPMAEFQLIPIDLSYPTLP